MINAGDSHHTSAPALKNRWTDIFKRDMLVHVGVMGSIIVGTFQGYLKDRIGGPIPYALAELFFIAAVIVWFGTIATRNIPIRGPGVVPAVILTAVLVPVLYVTHPGSPMVIEIAGLRAWAEYPVACLIALTVIKTPGQVRAYVGLILGLCIITAIYGIYQYQTGSSTLFGSSALAQLRHGSSVFYNIAGTSERSFRAFSTFTFPSPFAGMMVFGTLLAAGIAVSDSWRPRSRLLVAALIPLFFMGITVSGTRAAIIMLLLGLLVLSWYRGLGLRVFGIMPFLVAALYAGSLLTSGRTIARWQSVFLEEGLLWTYMWAPITIALRTLAEFPFGMGLGRSGVGVPFSIFQSYPDGFFRGSDGDVGRAAVEMGVFGIALLLLVVGVVIPYAARSIKQLRQTASQDVAIGIGALVVSTGMMILIGSPLSSAPHGLIWWFLLGALFKLSLMPRQDGHFSDGH
ncbi:hypothetical protein ACFL3B_03480 [Gemmatimonadota bacterium]